MAGTATPGWLGRWVCFRATDWHLREAHQGEFWIHARERMGQDRKGGDAQRMWLGGGEVLDVGSGQRVLGR